MARRRDEYDPDDDYIPVRGRSSSRAVAWGALFFSVMAMVISLGTLFLTWHDGELVKNALLLSNGLAQHWHRAAATTKGASAITPSDATATDTPTPDTSAPDTASSAGSPALPPIASNPTEASKLQGIRSRLEELAQKIGMGDKDVGVRLEELRREMEGLGHYASQATTKWVTPALAQLRVAREELQQNGPQAAAKLRLLATDLRNRLGNFRAGSSTNAANSDATPTPTPDSGDSAAPGATNDTAMPDPGADNSNANAPPVSAPLDRPNLHAANPQQ